MAAVFAMSQTTSAVARGFKEVPGRANVEPGRVSAVARDGGRGRVRSGTSGRVWYLSRGECGAGARRAARGVGGGGGVGVKSSRLKWIRWRWGNKRVIGCERGLRGYLGLLKRWLL